MTEVDFAGDRSGC